ncbi:MAG: IS66 family transposase [Marinilabilia sp.]
MNIENISGINDIDELKETLLSLVGEFDRKELNYKSEIKNLNEQIKSLQDRLFGRKTEKIHKDDGQISLFAVPEPELPILEKPEAVIIPEHTRKKRGRKPLPENLPRIDVVHELSEDERQCGCGCLKDWMGQEVSEQLDYIPAKVRVIRNIRYKYACKNCEGTEDEKPAVSIARMPDQIIPKSIATPGLLAHILTAKFADALPFYRQEKQFQRLGIDLPRSTMCGWAMKTAEACEIILDMMKNAILKSDVINIDETPVQVLKEPGRIKSYMWVFKGTSRGSPILLYHYDASRSGDVAASFLNGYKGIVQTDGYSGYGFLDNEEDILHVGCWVHARRKFVEVTKAAGKKSKNPAGNAGTALKYIGMLYKIEKTARANQLSPGEIYEKRQAEAAPILDEFKKWLDVTVEKVPPKSLLGKAVNYTLSEWDRLIRYIEDGRVGPDNNAVENAIRPFVVGRKNWLFNCTPEGARASAAIYSIIETAKANGLEPYWYLKHLFENLPEAMSDKDFQALLPQQIEKDQITVLLP